MNSGLYTAASGLSAERSKLDMIGNNLANASTAGYRAQRTFSRIFRSLAPGAPEHARAANAAVAVAGTYEQPGSGILRPTGSPLDVALPERILLTVETAAGPRYTRNGSLRLSAEGELTDSAGRRLLDAKGKMIAGLDETATVASDGRVLVDGDEVGRLALVRHDLGELRREGDGLLAPSGGVAPRAVQDAQIRPGWIEGSGTDAMTELISMIEAQRAFEAYQKLISLTMNDVNRRAVNDLAG